MSSLRIALDSSPLHGHRTGVGVATEHLLAGLRQRPDVSVIPYVVSFRAQLAPDERRLSLPAAITSRLWAVADRPRADRWFGDADVIHGTNYGAPPTALPTVVSVYDCWFLAHPDRATPEVRRAGAALRRAAARGAFIHTSSSATAERARKLLGTDRVEVVHLGPPTPPTATPAPAPTPTGSGTPIGPLDRGAPFVLAIGTVERRKDLPTLVDAFALVASLHPDLELVIAGAAGDDGRRLADHVTALDPRIAARVHMVGPVDADTKGRLLDRASVLAYPSLDEGFGFPILEAQQHGVPVVGSAAGSIPEVGGRGVELCTPADPADLARALGRVLGDEAHRRDLIAAGTENLVRFDWDRTTEELVKLYRRVADQGGIDG